MALKKTKLNLFSKETMRQMAKEYDDISSKMKELKKTQSALSDKLKEGARRLGVKDDKGSFYYDSDDFIVGSVSSKKMSINVDKAIELLKDSDVFDDVVKSEIVYTIDEEALERAVQNGKISINLVESMTDVSESFRVSVKRKEVAPEVEVSTLKAARTK